MGNCNLQKTERNNYFGVVPTVNVIIRDESCSLELFIIPMLTLAVIRLARALSQKILYMYLSLLFVCGTKQYELFNHKSL